MRSRVLTGTGLLALIAAVVTGGPAQAQTRVEGQYQLMMDLRKTQRFFPWDWDSNNNDNWTGAELRLFSQPKAGVEAFFRVVSDWNDPNNNAQRPQFQFQEAHLRYRWELGRGRGVDMMLFSRQDRFWVENHLIRVVEGGRLTDNSNAQGVRLDAFGWAGFSTTLIASDFSGQYNPVLPEGDAGRGDVNRTDDAFIARVRRNFTRDQRLRTGFTYSRKSENQLSEQIQRAETLHGDARYLWRGPRIGTLDFSQIDIAVEYAESRSPISEVTFEDELEREITVGGRSIGLRLPNRSVAIAEIRTIKFGNPWSGFVNFAPTWWQRGPLWDNRTGDGTRDETGFNLNTWYLLPDRAVTFTNNYRSFTRRAFESRTQTELYNELYIEFVRGFTGRVFLRQRDIITGDGPLQLREEQDDFFTELQVESRLAWLRLQNKIKDIGTEFRKELYSMETRINLNPRVQLYNRFTFGNDASILRKGLFSQLRYRPTDNMEMFVEYGPFWIGDSATPVDDTDLEGGGDQFDVMRFIMVGRF